MVLIGAIAAGYLFLSNLLIRCFEPCAELKKRSKRRFQKIKVHQDLKDIKDLNRSAFELIWELRQLRHERVQNHKLTKQQRSKSVELTKRVQYLQNLLQKFDRCPTLNDINRPTMSYYGDVAVNSWKSQKLKVKLHKKKECRMSKRGLQLKETRIEQRIPRSLRYIYLMSTLFKMILSVSMYKKHMPVTLQEHIYVETMTHGTLAVPMDLNIKKWIHHHTGIPSHHQCLYFNGKYLGDDIIGVDREIKEESTNLSKTRCRIL
mmetsp:Transcript_15938/g.18796  ORF Transcript_15938/g.18796 Transcript_15938/m.18796 type:complete len:262 (-) Transcript_15938:674-1459(-)